MVTWLVELLEFDLQYKPCGPMKTQFMANFLAEFSRNKKPPQIGGASTSKVHPT